MQDAASTTEPEAHLLRGQVPGWRTDRGQLRSQKLRSGRAAEALNLISSPQAKRKPQRIITPVITTISIKHHLLST